MIETKIEENENGVYVLEIKDCDGKIIREVYDDKDKVRLYEIADIAEELYEYGYSDGKYG